MKREIEKAKEKVLSKMEFLNTITSRLTKIPTEIKYLENKIVNLHSEKEILTKSFNETKIRIKQLEDNLEKQVEKEKIQKQIEIKRKDLSKLKKKLEK